MPTRGPETRVIMQWVISVIPESRLRLSTHPPRRTESAASQRGETEARTSRTERSWRLAETDLLCQGLGDVPTPMNPSPMKCGDNQ